MKKKHNAENFSGNNTCLKQFIRQKTTATTRKLIHTQIANAY